MSSAVEFCPGAVEHLCGVGGYREQSGVVDDQLGAQDLGDGLGDGVVGVVTAQEHAEVLQGETGNLQPLLDRLLREGLEQECLDGPGVLADEEVHLAVQPFQCSQHLLGRRLGRGSALIPGL